MKDINITRQCVIANMRRVLEILESDIELKNTWHGDSLKTLAELKCKMHEIRRDTVEIEKSMK